MMLNIPHLYSLAECLDPWKLHVTSFQDETIGVRELQDCFTVMSVLLHIISSITYSGSVCSHVCAAAPCVRVKDSWTKALQMGQCWKCDTQLSHTQACLQGSSTLFTAAFWHTTQSLPLPSDQSSSSSCSCCCTGICSTLLASSLGSLGWVLCSDAPPLSADMKRGCRRQEAWLSHSLIVHRDYTQTDSQCCHSDVFKVLSSGLETTHF